MAKKRKQRLDDDETVVAHVVITASKRQVRKAGHKAIKGHGEGGDDGRKQPRWRQI